ncbi:MAG: hypothetical protein H5T86_00200 [Armatimonadetes bacterium]|nr:hypothetical protein [Armatimonadota bacterium]
MCRRLPKRSLLASSLSIFMPAVLCLVLHGFVSAQPTTPSSVSPLVIQPTPGNLEGLWLFHTDPSRIGEEQGWHRPDFDDSAWSPIFVPASWEDQGVISPDATPQPLQFRTTAAGAPAARNTPYDGTAWYRLHILIPSAWANENLVLLLGSVDDFDRTFFNGHLVGSVGPEVQHAVRIRRKYTIPASLVRPGRDNVLAIEVTDGGGPGGLVGQGLSLLPKAVLEAMMTVPSSDRPFADRFSNPPAESRILKIIHSLPVSPDDQDRLFDELILCGFGGMVCNVPFEDYMRSEEKWAAFVRAVKEARRRGMALWLYDEHGYPSGVAWGRVLEGHPEYQAQGLLIARTTCNGGPVLIESPPGELVLAAAFPLREEVIDPSKAISLTEHLRDGRLSWSAPPDRWLILVITRDYLYEGTHAAVSLADKLPYINLLMPEPTQRFLKLTHDQYAARLGDDLGQYFVSTFTDEPSLMSRFFRPMPYAVLPWSPNFPEEFRKRRGYDLLPHLPLLVADAGGQEKKVRHDFWLTVAELVSENYFGQIQQWCRSHNLRSGGHLLLEENISDHVALYGDFFRCVRRLDAPSIDCLTSIPENVPWRIARLISSIADLEGYPVTMCETSDHAERYRPPGDNRPRIVVSEDQIRGTCNRLVAGGITTITSYYSFTGLDTPALRRLNDWIGRCSTALAGGHHVTDLAMLYPVESMWVHQRPASHGPTSSPRVQQIAALFASISDTLFASRRDFTYIDAQAIVQSRAENGFLVHGPLRWRCVILPMADTLPLAAWYKLRDFWRSGGILLALGSLPENSSERFPDPRVEAIAREIFGPGFDPRTRTGPRGGIGVFLPHAMASLVPAVLDSILSTDVSVAPPDAPIRYTHRRVDGREVYFLINDSSEPCEARISLCASGPGQQADPATGQIAAVPSPEDIHLSLGPYGAMLFLFPQARLPERHRPASGPLPGLTTKPVPAAEPHLAKGEFVDGAIQRRADIAAAHGPVWETRGRLLKSNVDTFLFLTFDYPAPIDLTGSIGLLFDVWVPDGQRTSAKMHAILREAGGGQYLASISCSLSEAGHQQTFVPFSAFRAASWAKDQNGRLDLSEIVGISVGWGGYYGTAGETIKFSSSVPRLLVPSR